MNTLAIRKLREKLAAGQAVYGLWVTLESASVTEMAVALGLDWVVIDAEHGHLDWKEIVEHLRAAVRSETVALVRIAELDRGLIKRALDIGADGVVVPWMETEDQLRQAVAFARYPPEGCRGIGGERATGWGECLAEHTAEANDHVLVVPIIESVRAVAAGAADVPGRRGGDLLLRAGRFLGDRRISRPVGRTRRGRANPRAEGHDPPGRQALRGRGDRHGQPRRALRAGVPDARPGPRRRPACSGRFTSRWPRSAATARSGPGSVSTSARPAEGPAMGAR